ncbi:hypothetical protein K2173_018576 [Erythroxylum novogranatense]|uniref:BZIP domain-containing protein n=1 Tax=Erythroxylum novogranatense TaxID=1862640 RepID=A0AAV8UEG1_9ROSI|nr:hypothetical protein K2173_018576 [Erythroxylum novogranatense]
MDLERGAFPSRSCSSATCSSSSSSSLSPSLAADPMVRIELEAAEVLADLAHFAMREANVVSSNSKWGCKGKRAKKRVKTESPLSDSAFIPVDAATLRSHLVPDETEADQQLCEPSGKNLLLNQTQGETDADIPENSRKKTCLSFGGGRSRQNLTEAEREERRLRRILANRESARQTIRRRQALCEELARKAADLSRENQNLTKERESALKEFQSLETINQQLKAQMAKLIKPEVEESAGNFMSAYGEMRSSQGMNCPMLLYKHHPFSSLFWPSRMQSLNPAQSRHMHQNEVIPSSIPFSGKLDSYQQRQEISVNENGARTLYLVSSPWFFPEPEHSSRLHSQTSSGLKHLQNGTTVNKQCRDSKSSTTVTFAESGHLSLALKVKSSTEVGLSNDLSETPRFPPDGGVQCAGMPTKEIWSRLMPFSVEHDNELQLEHTPRSAGVFAKTSKLISALKENTQDAFKLHSKKRMDAASAAEARRRRKELTKLKNLHGRQCRMNC